MRLHSFLISVSTSLPSTASIKPVECWLIFNLAFPFMLVIVATIEKVPSPSFTSIFAKSGAQGVTIFVCLFGQSKVGPILSQLSIFIFCSGPSQFSVRVRSLLSLLMQLTVGQTEPKLLCLVN